MPRLTDKQRVANRDHDERYLPDLGAALESTCSALYDAMYGLGLRIVRDDRADPPQRALIEAIEDLQHKYQQPGFGDYAGKVAAYEVVNDLTKLLDL